MGRKIYRTPQSSPDLSPSRRRQLLLLPPTMSSSTGREHAMMLMNKRDQVEREIKDHHAILRSNDNIGMNEPLVDSQGFPRADVDVYAVRHARVRIIELNNDLKSLTNEIAEALNAVYAPLNSTDDLLSDTDDKPITASPSSSPSSRGISSGGPGATPHPDRVLRPFAKVDGVMPGSPAAEAGLRRDDTILQFGGLTYERMTGGLQPIAQLVAAQENRTIVIRIRRPNDNFDSDSDNTSTHDRDLNFIPRKWGGRGLLGCHIVPVL